MRRTWLWAAAVAAVVAVVGPVGPAAAGGPSVRIVPSPVSAGSVTTAYAAGFCPRPCGLVHLTVGGVEVATAQPRGRGVVRLRFEVRQIPGQYAVEARQATPSGPRRASVGLVVLAGDRPSTVQRVRVDPRRPVPTFVPEPTAAPEPSPSPVASSPARADPQGSARASTSRQPRASGSVSPDEAALAAAEPRATRSGGEQPGGGATALLLVLAGAAGLVGAVVVAVRRRRP